MQCLYTFSSLSSWNIYLFLVSDAAKQALGIELSSRKEYSIERLEEILTDIELNLAVIHEEGKLEFSDNEMDNFADCY